MKNGKESPKEEPSLGLILEADRLIREKRQLVAKVIGGEVAWSPQVAAALWGECRVLRQIQSNAIVHLGARLFLLKENLPHGEFEKRCKEEFPECSQRKIRYWMAAFRRQADLPAAYRRRALPPPEDDAAFDDPGFDEDLRNPDAAVKTYTELKGERDRLVKQVEVGREKSEAKDERIAELEAALEKARAGDHLSEAIKEEPTRIAHIRNRFGGFLLFWHQHLPQDLDALAMHFSLCGELTTLLAEQRERMLIPHAEKIEAASERAAKAKKPAAD